LIIAAASRDRIIAAVSPDLVVAVPDHHHIVSAAGVDLVVSAQIRNHVIAAAAGKLIVPVAAVEPDRKRYRALNLNIVVAVQAIDVELPGWAKRPDQDPVDSHPDLSVVARGVDADHVVSAGAGDGG